MRRHIATMMARSDERLFRPILREYPEPEPYWKTLACRRMRRHFRDVAASCQGASTCKSRRNNGSLCTETDKLPDFCRFGTNALNNINRLLYWCVHEGRRAPRSVMATLTVVATSELARFAGVASGVGFSIYAGFSFENTPMHHWSQGAFPGLHTLWIRRHIFFSG